MLNKDTKTTKRKRSRSRDLSIKWLHESGAQRKVHVSFVGHFDFISCMDQLVFDKLVTIYVYS